MNRTKQSEQNAGKIWERTEVAGVAGTVPVITKKETEERDGELPTTRGHAKNFTKRPSNG